MSHPNNTKIFEDLGDQWQEAYDTWDIKGMTGAEHVLKQYGFEVEADRLTALRTVEHARRGGEIDLEDSRDI